MKNKFKMNPTNEEEEVDIIVQWQMPAMNKRGFYSLFKVGLLKLQKQLTEQQNRLVRQKSVLKEEGGIPKQLKDMAAKINPLHVAYSYQRTVDFNFS